ncbi:MULTISPECIES: hypothetical protein [unclassified Leptolyngbya]|uniref:LIC_10190 family membrane protein n=1 Tax=unclassified Leptolyngbya TaxID=2650499 RepID=UPI00168281A5|nr:MULTISPECIES: hypothetical protein [unclassified Leptolyngbya]MBD1913097.1 hypothetical protein [Leptolyngbya sp. FACHB-8]MBD2155558.1 hypothetical protein [Leptolyngbya sp. FACHB-16]
MLYFLFAWAILATVSLAIGSRLTYQLGLSYVSTKAAYNPRQLPGIRHEQSKTAVLNPIVLRPKPDFGSHLLKLETLLALWLGIVCLAVSLLAVSLILPLSPWIGGLVAMGWITWSASHPDVRRELVRLRYEVLSRQGLEVGAIALVAAGVTTGPVTWGDTGLYHFGSIRWLADYGTVMGVGLIHDRFSFASSWFALAAPLNPAFLGSHVTAVTNGFMLCLAMVHWWATVTHLRTKKPCLADWFSLSALTCLLALWVGSSLLSDLFVSPSPDIPVMLLSLLSGWLLLQLGEYHLVDRVDGILVSLLILGAGAVTIKLSGLPLLAVAVFAYLFHYRRRYWALLKGVGLVVAFLTPTALYGYMTSGCAFYPASLLCVDVPWGIPSDAAAAALAQIQGWFKWFGTPPEGKPWLLWVMMQWFSLSTMNKVMAGLAVMLLVTVLLLIRRWTRTPPSLHAQAKIWMIALAILGSLFTFATAPLIRFGLGYLLLIPALLMAWIAHRGLGLWLERNPGWKRVGKSLSFGQLHRKRWLSVGAIALLVAIGLVKGTNHFLLPPSLPRPALVAAQSGDVSYVYPVRFGADVCWGAPNPCALGPLDWEVRLRNPQRGIAGGIERAPVH